MEEWLSHTAELKVGVITYNLKNEKGFRVYNWIKKKGLAIFCKRSM